MCLCMFSYLVSNNGNFINFLRLAHLKLWLLTGWGLPECGRHTPLRDYNCWCCMNTLGRLDLFETLESEQLGVVTGKPWNFRLRLGWHGWHIWLETARREGLKCMAEVLGSKAKSCLSNCFYIFLCHVKFCLHRHMVCSYQAREEFAFLIYSVKSVCVCESTIYTCVWNGNGQNNLERYYQLRNC